MENLTNEIKLTDWTNLLKEVSNKYHYGMNCLVLKLLLDIKQPEAINRIIEQNNNKLNPIKNLDADLVIKLHKMVNYDYIFTPRHLRESSLKESSKRDTYGTVKKLLSFIFKNDY